MGCGVGVVGNNPVRINKTKSISILISQIAKDFYTNLNLCKEKFIGPYFLLDVESANLGLNKKLDYYKKIELLLDLIQYLKIISSGNTVSSKIRLGPFEGFIDSINKSLIDNVYVFNLDVINSEQVISFLEKGNFISELKQIILTGIGLPQLFRYLFWKVLLMNNMKKSNFKPKIFSKKDYYALSTKLDESNRFSEKIEIFTQIKCDIDRTCPNSPYLYDNFYVQLELSLQKVAICDTS